MLPNSADTTRVPSVSAAKPLRHLWQVPVFFLGLLAVVGVCVARPPWRPVDAERAERDLAAVRQLLDQPDSSTDQVRALVERLEEQRERLPQHEAEIRFLLGSGYLRLAGTMIPPEPHVALGKARRHLEEAERLGVPDSDRLRLTYRLAKVWFLTGGDLTVIIDYLSRSIDKGADDPFEGYGMLTQAYLRLPSPDHPNALRANEKQLQLPRDRDELLAPVRLVRAELLFQLQKPEEARLVLANIGGRAPPALLAQARYLRARSLQEEQHWEEAAAVWKELLTDRRTAPRDPSGPLYQLGFCYRQLDQLEDAARAWTLCAQRTDGGDEEVAAALGLAEVRLLEQSAAAVEAFERAMRNVKGPADWHNSLIDLERVRALFEQGCTIYREAGDFDHALQLARVYEKLALPGKAAFLRAQAADASARTKQGEEARALLLQAGEAYEQAAAHSARPVEQGERYRLSADRYRQGRDPHRTVAVLGRYLPLEKDGRRLAEGWLWLAEAHRELKHLPAARTAYRECIKYDTPFAYRACFQLAQLDIASGAIDDAVATLEKNLQLLATDPDAEAEEKSLYTLGHLHFQRSDYNSAIARLEQALRTYPNSPDAVRGRFQLAACHSLLASKEKKASANDAQVQQHYSDECRRKLKLAAQHFQQLIDLLGKRPSESLSADEKRYLRQAWFGVAEARFDLGQWKDAIFPYLEVASQGRGRVEEVYALSRILLCRQLVREKAMADQNQKAVQDEETQIGIALARFRIAMEALDDKAFEGESYARQNYVTLLQSWEKWLASIKQ